LLTIPSINSRIQLISLLILPILNAIHDLTPCIFSSKCQLQIIGLSPKYALNFRYQQAHYTYPLIDHIHLLIIFLFLSLCFNIKYNNKLNCLLITLTHSPNHYFLLKVSNIFIPFLLITKLLHFQISCFLSLHLFIEATLSIYRFHSINLKLSLTTLSLLLTQVLNSLFPSSFSQAYLSFVLTLTLLHPNFSAQLPFLSTSDDNRHIQLASKLIIMCLYQVLFLGHQP